MTKHESMNWWIQKAGTFGKVMLRRRKKSVQIFALSNLSRITSYKKNWNVNCSYQTQTINKLIDFKTISISYSRTLSLIKTWWINYYQTDTSKMRLCYDFRPNLGLKKNYPRIKNQYFKTEDQKNQDLCYYWRSTKTNQNIIGINKETGQECFKTIIAEEETHQDRQVINYINERARRHWRRFALSIKTYSQTQDKVIPKKNSSEDLEGSRRLTQIRSDVQRWASGQFRCSGMSQWSTWMGQRTVQGWANGQVARSSDSRRPMWAGRVGRVWRCKARQNCIWVGK